MPAGAPGEAQRWRGGTCAGPGAELGFRSQSRRKRPERVRAAWPEPEPPAFSAGTAPQRQNFGCHLYRRMNDSGDSYVFSFPFTPYITRCGGIRKQKLLGAGAGVRAGSLSRGGPGLTLTHVSQTVSILIRL